MKLESVELAKSSSRVDSIEITKLAARKEKEKRKKRKKRTEKCVANNHNDSNGVCDDDEPIKKITNVSNDVLEIDFESLKESTKSENQFVKRLINTIPKSIYFKTDNLHEIREEKHAIAQEKLEDIGLKRKADKLSKSVRNKRAKLDPKQQKSVAELQEGLATPKSMNPKSRTMQPSNHPQQHGIEALRQRLQVKLASLRSSRQSIKSSDIAEKKRLKRQMNAMKRKEKKKLMKQRGPTINTSLTAVPEKKGTPIPPSKPVYNKDGKMVFSKFDFSENGNDDKSRRKGDFAGKDYKSLLNKLDRDKEKFAKLKETDEEKAKLVRERNLWKNALDKAEGVKVKKDEELLKKALKRKEYKKKKSRKGWEERDEAVKQKKEQKQKKREKNIQARKQDKKKHKMKRGAKVGRLLPHAL